MLANLLGVVVNVIFLTYVQKLEKDNCECSEDKLRDYIKYFSGAMVGLFVLNLVLSILSISVQVPKVLMLLVSLTILGAGIYQVYALFKYSHKLTFSEPECKCSKDWRRSFMFYFSIFYAIVLSMIAIQMVLLLIRLATMSKVDKAKLMKAVKKAQNSRNALKKKTSSKN
jgi:hypothetical protein